MNYTAIAIVVAVSATIASFVSFISQIILSRQERLAKQLQQMAGIIKIERKESKHPSQLTQLLNENEPTTSLRVQVSSGASFLQQNLVSLRNMLARGIRIQFLLFNPNTDSKLLEENPNLYMSINLSLEILKELMHMPEAQSGQLSVHLVHQPPSETLFFIDDEILILSSNLPVKSQNRLFYIIKKGEQSIYNMFEDAFQFQWENAEPFPS